MDPASDYLERNRSAWNRRAADYVETAERNWAASGASWGRWSVPESALGVLPAQLVGLDCVELGCGTAYVSAWLARRGARPVGVDQSEEQLATAARLQAEHELRFPLLRANAEIVGAATAAAAQRSPDAILVIVSNPLDAMCEVARRVSGFPRERVIGMAGVLDSARFATFIARELSVSVENVNAFVLGGHGDQMVPLPRYSTVAGVPITELLDAAAIERLVKRTAGGGGEIVGLLKTGSAYYAPARSAAEMVDAILKNKHKILPCAAYLQGEYGIEGLFIGVPCKLGAAGLEQVVEVTLTAEEKAALAKSAAAVRELVDALPVLAPAG